MSPALAVSLFREEGLILDSLGVLVDAGVAHGVDVAGPGVVGTAAAASTSASSASAVATTVAPSRGSLPLSVQGEGGKLIVGLLPERTTGPDMAGLIAEVAFSGVASP